jgi:nitroreductase
MNLIQNLKWRYATKKFDATKKVGSVNLEKLKEAVQLSASSYGLQPYEVFIIEDKELRVKLKEASWGQSQIVDASHLIVFCNFNQILDSDIEKHVKLKSEIQGIDLDSLKRYGDFIKSKIEEKLPEEQANWTARQTYIGLANLLAACAELKIDACPMEGFDPNKYDQILGLSEKGLSASVVATIGYRAAEDDSQNAKKVRKPVELLFVEK